jgi:cell division protein FtsW (lipid II flippase)
MNRYLSARDMDWPLLLITLALCGVGVLQIYSATLDNPQYHSAWWRQIVYIAGGLLLMWLILAVDYHTLLHYVPSYYIIREGCSARESPKAPRPSSTFLPVPYKDFIFSAFAEEHGFVGVVIVLALYFVMIMRIVQNAQTAPERAGMYICMGVAALLLSHILINVGMVAGLMPVTGIPLPFMSAGGSSIWTSFLALGLVNNVRLRRFVN